MKAAFLLYFLSVTVTTLAAYSGDGKPCCGSTNEIGQLYANFWDPTKYWRCDALFTPVSMKCEDQHAFFASKKICVPWIDWYWEEKPLPPKCEQSSSVLPINGLPALSTNSIPTVPVVPSIPGIPTIASSLYPPVSQVSGLPYVPSIPSTASVAPITPISGLPAISTSPAYVIPAVSPIRVVPSIPTYAVPPVYSISGAPVIPSAQTLSTSPVSPIGGLPVVSSIPIPSTPVTSIQNSVAPVQ
ncbi:RNA-binding protein 12-like [Teleopsis dalmanni]|uniref:RNA-binding protein 12-like n=1 Tax=Teleopsis dalmanni TaxID=139649 RepID=UPI0018CCC42D|nr:RNA-binding protein 12-like [Teleopsis dalmanni]